jgi:hypothetical protein
MAQPSHRPECLVMAWMFERKTVGINYTDFDLEGDFPSSIEEYQAFREGRDLDRPPTNFPVARQMKQTSGRLPDFVTIRVFHFCSLRLKKFLESWEPGVHLFSPVTLLRKNGDPIGEYYVWTVGQDVDCIFTESLKEFWRARHLNFVAARYSAWSSYKHKQGSTIVQISRPAIAGRHLWTAGLLSALGQGLVTYFMSDAMYRAYKKEKFTGFELVAPAEEIDRPWVAEENMGIMLEMWRERENNIRAHWPEPARRHGGTF